MKLAKEKEKAEKIVALLAAAYPEARCSLNYSTPFQLLVATRLSAQCTDARVNQVTPSLFKIFPTPEAFANAKQEKVEALIKTCGLFHTKARDLILLGKALLENFGGEVPATLEELVSLPGIGRKTANLILGDIYGQPAVVADTHFIRLCNRFGFLNSKDPKKAEDTMRKLLPPQESSNFCHRTVLHGRAVCTARNPQCENCCLNRICAKTGVTLKEK